MDKITTKQAHTLFMLAAFSPMIRLCSAAGAYFGERAFPVSVILASALFFGFCLLMGRYFMSAEITDLNSLYKTAFGKFIARLILLIYALWIFALAGFYLRGFAERFAGTIMPSVPSGFFAVTLLVPVYIILHGKIRAFALMCGIFFYAVIISLILVFGFQITKIRPENLLPITHLDAGKMLWGMLPILGVFAYITPMLFLGSQIDEKQDFHKWRKYSLISASVLLCGGIIIHLLTTGIFGVELTREMQQPLLMSVKTVGIMDSLERLESVFLLLWIVTDLAIIVLFSRILMRLTNAPAAPVVIGLYILSRFSIDAGKLGLWINLLMGFAIPALAFALISLKTALKRLSGRGSRPTMQEQSQPD